MQKNKFPEKLIRKVFPVPDKVQVFHQQKVYHKTGIVPCSVFDGKTLKNTFGWGNGGSFLTGTSSKHSESHNGTIASGGSRISQMGVSDPKKGGQPIIWLIFPETDENEEF